MIRVYKGDCLRKMMLIPSGTVGLVLTDPPYGTTACRWDTLIPFKPMREQIWRVLKPNGACALFGSEPFSSHLRMSQLLHFKYDWIWKKNNSTGHVHAKNKPMKNFEVISIFSEGVTAHKGQSKKRMHYYPQGLVKIPPRLVKSCASDVVMGLRPSHRDTICEYENYPRQILEFPRPRNNVHPTKKPVALLEYLVKTYTNEGETVLDFTMGSGSTGVACVNTLRDFIGIEQEAEYFDIAKGRITSALEERRASKEP